MLGVVLAGGKSRRFGIDKLLYKVNGKPLILHTIERLEMSREINEIVIVAAPWNKETMKSFGYEVVVDDLLLGPISGVYTALSLGDSFIVGGDMPSLIPEFIDYIIKEFNNYGKIVCVPRWENGYLEPLHAAYSKKFREILEERIKRGLYKLGDAIIVSNPCYIRIEDIPVEWRVSFFNVNRKEDLKIIT
ncbi:molybdopterin-guanine dinucleotide biosynthesis protein A [Pyrococcus sp. NA2]|uniref:molybdenum cofactor guanylyltransferase MobA n=1 Tax=Pyrococcus sp. (strain NA2) TaxID=342949 RepID=UPI000209AA38|nr:molybdenum cofactor guanylyltransferase MobA [Pyrococcus sp. NA2]AEC52570.1 molybdopterin-guanine dinucleotide biosynthesis protein A [Pyrococcus sp. NA2]